jgi:hypothetical protein
MHDTLLEKIRVTDKVDPPTVHYALIHIEGDKGGKHFIPEVLLAQFQQTCFHGEGRGLPCRIKLVEKPKCRSIGDHIVSNEIEWMIRGPDKIYMQAYLQVRNDLLLILIGS